MRINDNFNNIWFGMMMLLIGLMGGVIFYIISLSNIDKFDARSGFVVFNSNYLIEKNLAEFDNKTGEFKVLIDDVIANEN